MRSLCCCLLFLSILCGCIQQPREEKGTPSTGFERIPYSEFPALQDDMDPESLRAAVRESLNFLERVPGERTFPLGDLQVRADLLKASLLLFLQHVESNRLDTKSIAESFDLYHAASRTEPNHQLVTGYYEPILEGRLEKDKEFCYPLYGIPPDMVTVELSMFDPDRFSTEKLVGRLKEKRLVPYYARAEIDGGKALDQFHCELVWLRDPIDAFFLHIQGSGMIRLAGGQFRRLGYAGANGRTYRSIGKDLLDQGVIKREDMSLQAIRDFLRGHPEVRNEIMWRNESYVFFRWVDIGPLGSLNVPLTPGRSIATDTRYHPRGALAFLETEKPRLDGYGEVSGWEPLRRWVLNQDTGGAIKGIGRVDLFCGTGDDAEAVAGRLKHPGRLFFLLKKEGKG